MGRQIGAHQRKCLAKPLASALLFFAATVPLIAQAPKIPNGTPADSHIRIGTGASDAIEIFAGGGTEIEGKPASQCKISQPFGIAFDAQDNAFICEESHRILRVDAITGILTVVSAAKKSDAKLGDGGPAADANFSAPHNLVADWQGNLFIADTGHNRVRRIDAKTGIVTTVAGTGMKQLSGDGGPASEASLDGIACLCFNRDFTKLYLGGFSKAIRVIDMKTAIISTVPGIAGSRAVTVDSKGNLFTAAGRGLRMLDASGQSIDVEDSTAKPPPIAVKHLWADREDNILIADEGNNLIRKFLVREKRLVTLAGTGVRGAEGVPGAALEAQLAGPHGVVTHPRTGDIYIADSRNHRVLRIKVAAKDQRIFSTGHSFHFGFPPILEAISKSGGFKDTKIVGVSSIGGSKVSAHVGRKEVNAALADGAVDVLMTTPIYLPDPGIEQFAELGMKHNADFRLTVMEFWLPFDNYEPRNYSNGPKGSPTEHVNPPAKVDHNAATAEALRKIHERYFQEMNDHVIAVNEKLGKRVVFVVPAGQAVIALREKIIAGKAPGLKSQEDLFTDGLGHPKSPISVLMGYCHYGVIYRKSPIGLPVPKALKIAGDSDTAAALNKLLQELAWEAVVNHPLSGVGRTGLPHSLVPSKPEETKEDWISLFNGKDLTGWKANRKPESFSVEDGVIVVRPVDESSHLFYVGDGTEGSATFKNFELKAMARCDGKANSGIYFHSAIDSGKGPKNHLSKGYEVQLNNTDKEKKKTGSLYAVVDLDRSPVDETQWFAIRFIVDGKRVKISIDGKEVVDYTEPDDVKRPAAFAGRLLDPKGGAIALQGHDPTSVYYFKDILIKRLP